MDHLTLSSDIPSNSDCSHESKFLEISQDMNDITVTKRCERIASPEKEPMVEH
jgi:hypothetical protein